MNGNLRIGSLFGIPFFVNASWFLVFALITWDYGSQLGLAFPQLGASAGLLGLAAALLLFGSVVAHELGHSLVAMRQGIPVKSITLFIFGGLASLGEESKTPAESFWVAIAGPLVSFALFGILSGINFAIGLPTPIATVVQLVASINLMLGIFNLLPGLPLDGGNVVKALVWKLTGKPYKGIAFASRIGRFLGWLGIGLGGLSLLGFTQLGSFWTLLVGWFLLQNADRYAQAAAIQEQLSGLTAADAVVENSPIVPSQISLREFANQYIIGNPVSWKKYLVTDSEGQLIGQVEVEAMKTIPTNDWWDISVQQITQPTEQLETVPSDQPLLDVVNLIEEKNIPALVVLKEGKMPIGLLEKSSIVQLLQNRAAAKSNPEPQLSSQA
ncbi:site-2 protease family protein [Leptolyngbya ohadii]|uniref:site-2 protease family protein n=1 Tax=Leptolyngbya ohadii TaxID=1962290 RepID=UPI000B5995FB|nr:site-2 protease family protein [Leptolyngbya ohadii]